MKLWNAGEQRTRHFTYDASGTIGTGGVAQLLLPVHMSRSFLWFVNNSAAAMYVDIGGPRATCTISSNAVTSSFTINNAGFGYTKPPLIYFQGGGAPQGVVVAPSTGAYGQSTMIGPNNGFLGSTLGWDPNWPSPSRPARAHAVLTANAVSSIVLDDPGAGYLYAPLMFFINDDLDPVGAALPSTTAGAGSLEVVASGGSLSFNQTCCPTDQLAVICGTTGAGFTLKYMT